MGHMRFSTSYQYYKHKIIAAISAGYKSHMKMISSAPQRLNHRLHVQTAGASVRKAAKLMPRDQIMATSGVAQEHQEP